MTQSQLKRMKQDYKHHHTIFHHPQCYGYIYSATTRKKQLLTPFAARVEALLLRFLPELESRKCPFAPLLLSWFLFALPSPSIAFFSPVSEDDEEFVASVFRRDDFALMGGGGGSAVRLVRTRSRGCSRSISLVSASLSSYVRKQ